MDAEKRILNAAEKLPTDLAFVVLEDVNKRINDWLLSGGKANSVYIEQQVRYVEDIAKFCGVEEGE